MIKNNPHELLKNLPKANISDKVKEAIEIYDETAEELKEFPNDKKLKDMAEEIGKAAIVIIKSETEEEVKEEKPKKASTKKPEKKSENAIEEKGDEKKTKLKREEVDKAIAFCEKCKIARQKERQRKIAAGEIKPRKKKYLTTKLKEALNKIVNMMPEKVKKDEQKIKQTKRAVNKFLSEIKEIWEMNKICSIQEEIDDKFENLQEKAAA